MKITGTGFLSAKGTVAAESVTAGIAPVLALAEKAAALCHRGMTEISVNSQETPEEKQRVIACVMLARLLEITEATITLARGGFSVQVVSATREFLEAYFLFGNVCKDPAFVPEYFNTDLMTRQKIINQASKHKVTPFDMTNQYATAEVKAELKAQINEVRASELDTYKYASNVGCAALYDSLYRIASAATHSSPRSLGGYISEVDGIVVEVKRGPQLGEIAQRLLDQGSLLLNVRGAFEELFGLPTSPDSEILRKAFEDVDLSE
ncbi:MAG: DUF5677 domain-containing protein [Hylemonella sp.]